ncbi:hypothetical protein ANN_19680, partial [Periplaneta americana]
MCRYTPQIRETEFNDTQARVLAKGFEAADIKSSGLLFPSTRLHVLQTTQRHLKRRIRAEIAAVSQEELRKSMSGMLSQLNIGEEQRLRVPVFENKVLTKIFGAKRDEVTGEWRKLHNEELQALYSSLDIIRNIKSRRLRWAGHVARSDESRNAYRVLVGKPERKRPLGRLRRRWEDNIKMDLREVGYDDGDWINLTVLDDCEKDGTYTPYTLLKDYDVTFNQRDIIPSEDDRPTFEMDLPHPSLYQDINSDTVLPAISDDCIKPTEHGKKYESVAVREFEDRFGIVTSLCGLLNSSSHPFICASPDWVICEEEILEIKCPYSAQDSVISPETVDFLYLCD